MDCKLTERQCRGVAHAAAQAGKSTEDFWQEFASRSANLLADVAENALLQPFKDAIAAGATEDDIKAALAALPKK